MGVCASGKTTVGRALADRLGVPFLDGDDHHPPENIAKMRAGVPLDDEDRAPWLARLAARLQAHEHGIVLACSALKADYRYILAAFAHNPRFIYLRADCRTIEARMAARTDHFMPPSLVGTQFADLEEPTPEEALIIDATQPVDAIVDTILGELNPLH
jgi:gluconokinase